MANKTKKQLERGQLEVDTLKHFINGGTGIITITNTRTQQHVTLKFDVPEKKGEKRDPSSPIFVKLFSGNHGEDVRNKKAFNYFGCIWRKDRRTKKPQAPSFWFDHRKAKGGISRDDACVKTVSWLMRVASGKTPLVDYMQLWHEGICCFCNLPLTQTESIKRGYGPKCAKDRGLPYGKVTKKAKRSDRHAPESSPAPRPKQAEVIPAAKGDETYDERVADLISHGFSEGAAEALAEAELVQNRERLETERVAREKAELEDAQVGEPVEVPACADALDGFKWVGR